MPKEDAPVLVHETAAAQNFAPADVGVTFLNS
jgi:hypothetical protein